MVLQFLRNHRHRRSHRRSRRQEEEQEPHHRPRSNRLQKQQKSQDGVEIENNNNNHNVDANHSSTPTNRPRTHVCGTQDLSLADEVFFSWHCQDASQEGLFGNHHHSNAHSNDNPHHDGDDTLVGFATPSTPSGFPMAIVLHAGMERPRSVWELLILQCLGVIRDTPRWHDMVLDNNKSQWRRWKEQAGHQVEAELTRLCQGQVADMYRRFEALWLYAMDECRYLATLPHQQSLSAVDHVYASDFVSLQRSDCSCNNNNHLGEPLGQRIRRHLSDLQSSLPDANADRATPIVCLVDPSMYAYQTPHNSDDSQNNNNDMSVQNPMTASKMVAPPFSQVLGTHPPKQLTETAAASSYFPYFQSDAICRPQFISQNGFQWLPSEFYVLQDEYDGHLDCQINSYINSLHPHEHESLYRDLEQLFGLAVPLLEQALTEVSCVPTSERSVSLIRERELRVPVPLFQDYQKHCSVAAASKDNNNSSSQTRDSASRIFVPTFEKPYKEDDLYTSPRVPQVSLRDRPLQVHVRITNMELRPFQSEEYIGGAFRVEGMLDDRIVATACCCVESDNIEGGELEFRTSCWEPNSDDDRYNTTFGVASVIEEVEQWRTHVFGLKNGDRLVQPRGSCSTMEGRILAWPNTLQHRMTPARLVDRTRPGRRTWVEFFLVDPTLRIPSTATVPPQQQSWLESELDRHILARLVGEEANRWQILDYLWSFPDSPFLSPAQAMARQKALQNERWVTGERALLDHWTTTMPGNNNQQNNHGAEEQWEMEDEETEMDEFFAPVIQGPSFSLGNDEDV